MLGGSAALLSAPFSPALAALGEVRSLAFNNLHTGEQLSLEYWAQGRYLPDALSAVNHLLRDFRTGDTHAIDPQLLDLLAVIRGKLETTTPFSVISGYRSPATNDLTEGAARNSMHLRGRAADVHFEGFSTRLLAAMAKIFNDDGGTGIYLDMNMVHVDRGAPRAWQGSRPRRG